MTDGTRKPAEAPHVFDELTTQLPGRTLALEIMVTLLLRRRSDASALLAEAEAILDTQERAVLADTGGEAARYAFGVFAVARQNLAVIRRNTRPRER